MPNLNAKCIHRSKKKIDTVRCSEGGCGCAMKTPVYLCNKLGVSCTIGTCTSSKVEENCKTCKVAEVPVIVAPPKVDRRVRQTPTKSPRQILASRRGAFMAKFRKPEAQQGPWPLQASPAIKSTTEASNDPTGPTTGDSL